jgi:AcrR family transcriptional regulator
VPRTIPKRRFDDLLEAAGAVFLEEGYRRTQMADVAARLGVAKGTLYLYVDSKEALFDAVLRHADREGPVALPESLPLPTPAPGATLEMVRRRVAESASLPALSAALARRRVTDAGAELETILRELYALLARHRRGIKLLDRCSQDHPELAAAWYGTGRRGALGLLERHLAARSRVGHLAPVADAAVTARIVLETLVFWAVHRHWDPSPQAVDERVAEDAVVHFVLRALLPASPPRTGGRRPAR